MKAKALIYQRGVSIAELAVVVVVIALLLSIVAGGLNLRQASELRSFIVNVDGFQVAFEGFEYKYDELPGDMSDAHSNWDDGSNGICGTVAQCNGDGDGEIEMSSTVNDNESFRAWQHLVLSGFLSEGGYTGLATGDGDQADIGINVPRSSRSKVGYSVLYATTGGFSRNEFQIGSFSINSSAVNSALTPKEANIIDKKIDDGVPNDGKVFGFDGADVTGLGCANGNSYRLTLDSTVCRMSFPVN